MKKFAGLFLVAMALIMAIGLTGKVVNAQEGIDLYFGQPDFDVDGGESDLVAFVQLFAPEGMQVMVHYYEFGPELPPEGAFKSGNFPAGRVQFTLNPLATIFKFVVDPDREVEETNEMNNEARWPSVEVTPTPSPVSTSTIIAPTATPTATDIPVDCQSLWYSNDEEVTVSWNCSATAHLYLDGDFVEEVTGGSVTIQKVDFAVSIEVAIDPEGQDIKVFLLWEEIFGANQNPTSTPITQPTSSPVPTQTVVPTTTPSPLDPNPKVTVTANQVEVEDISPPWAIHLYWWESESTQPIFEWTGEAKSFEVQINDGLVEILILNGDEVVSKVEYLVRGKNILYIRDFLPHVSR